MSRTDIWHATPIFDALLADVDEETQAAVFAAWLRFELGEVVA